MKPLLAHIYEPHRVTFPCFVQPKFNGIRALYQDGFFQSRDELPWNQGILKHIAEELRELYTQPWPLDGELYVHGWKLQRINGAVTPIRNERSADTGLVEYHVFDQVSFTDSFETRWNRLPHGVEGRFVKFAETRCVQHLDEANAFYKEKVDQGYEGVMYRLGNCPYTMPKQPVGNLPEIFQKGYPTSRSGFLSDKDNRTWHLLKRKSWLDDEYTITGFTLTTGEKGEIGFQLSCITEQGRVFNVGSGLSDTERDYYAEHPPIGRQAKIKYLFLSEDEIPQNPTILAIL